MKLLLSLLLILTGIFAMVFGEADDSPGLQGIGMILIMVVLYLRFYKRKTK